MLALTNTAIEELNELRNKWKKFKNARLKGKYETNQGKDFITGIEREEIINELFDIFQNKTEEIKILETPKLF